MKHILKIVFLALTPLTAAAQHSDSLRTTALNPVVVTGTGTYHKADNSPVAVKVITAKELRDARVTSLQDALSRLTPNITTHTSGMGTFVNFNGVSDDYILILENGKRVSGDDRWERLSMNNVKRIEVYSSAASALYGSDAIAGVINIITDDSNQRVDVSSALTVMNKGRLDQHVDADINQGKFSSRTSYAHRQADNWQVNHYQAFDEDDRQVLKLTGRPMSAAFRSENISQQMEWRFDNRWSVYVKGNYYQNNTQRPRNATYFTQRQTVDKETGQKTFAYTPRQAYTYDINHQSYLYGAGCRWVPNSRTHVYLDVQSDNFRSRYDYWQTAEAEARKESRKRTHYIDEKLRGVFRLTDWNKLSAGMEFVQERLTSQSDHIEGRHTHSLHLFAQDEVDIPGGLQGVVGLRYTHNRHFGSHLVPNAAIFYRIAGFRFRASYAAGYRTPTLSQLYATDQAKTTSRYTLPNTALEPEKNHFWNFNVEHSNSWMHLGATAFLNRIRDMINYRTLTLAEVASDPALAALRDAGWTTLRQRDNIDHARLRGVSANARFFLPLGLSIGGGYTFTDSESKTQRLVASTQEYETTRTPVDKSVRHVGSVLALWDKSWREHHFNITLSGHMQSRRYSTTYGYAKGYGQWNLNARHSFSLEHFRLEPSLGIDNLFNQRDTSYWNSNFATISPGRSFIVGLVLNFKS